MNKKSRNLRELCVMAMLCAISFIAVVFIRIPIIPGFEYLKLDVKDAFLVMGGFLFGPLAGGIMATVVALIEMMTVSESGIIGFVMNAISSVSFVCVASAFYQHRKTLKNAVIGLVGGSITMTAGMLLWNYLITPLYAPIPRSTVLTYLVPVFLPFNGIKCVLNAALALLLYKSVVTALRRAKLLPTQEEPQLRRSVWPFALIVLLLVGVAIFLLKIYS